MLQVRGVRFGGRRPVVVVPVVGADRAARDAHAAAVLAQRASVDLVEWRADLATDLGGDPAAVVLAAHELVDHLAGIPLLLTVRTVGQGGGAALDAATYGTLLEALVDGGAGDLLDVEWAAGEVARRVVAHARGAGLPVVMSDHDWEGTPSAAALVERMAAMAALGADLVKVAVTPRSPADVLALLEATWTAAGTLPVPVVTIAMGELGVASRLVGGVFGSVATFAHVGEGSAPGQVGAAAVRRTLDLVHGPGSDPADGMAGHR